MEHRPSLIRAALVLIAASGAARADDSLAPETAKRLKEATVYVKVAIGPLTISGSGFVIQSSGDSALIVTNHHVVTKPKVLAPGGFVLGLRGRDRITLMRIQQALAGSEPVVSVVLNSGESNEQVVKAEVLGGLEDPDLAVLKVSALKRAPRAIEFRRTAQPSETMPVFILGFPFGESLAANKANPNITIGRGSVSSIRKDKSGKVVRVQIDGALNPGNSGGPVVDGAGGLVGIAVQTIQGSNIGLDDPGRRGRDRAGGEPGPAHDRRDAGRQWRLAEVRDRDAYRRPPEEAPVRRRCSSCRSPSPPTPPRPAGRNWPPSPGAGRSTSRCGVRSRR